MGARVPSTTIRTIMGWSDGVENPAAAPTSG
jgi:hypothetical protein